MTATPTERELEDFVYREARLLDEKAYEEWWGLFADDARYWMPLTRQQPDGESHTSLFYEDRLLLQVRIERLLRGAPFSQAQPSFSQHVLQRPQVEARDTLSGVIRTRTPFLYVESQLDEQLLLAGVAWHELLAHGECLKIRLKKIELLNCDAALPSIQLLL